MLADDERAGEPASSCKDVRREGRMDARTSSLACASMVVILSLAVCCGVASAGSLPSDPGSVPVLSTGSESRPVQVDGSVARAPSARAQRGTVRDHDFDRPTGVMALLMYLWGTRVMSAPLGL